MNGKCYFEITSSFNLFECVEGLGMAVDEMFAGKSVKDEVVLALEREVAIFFVIVKAEIGDVFFVEILISCPLSKVLVAVVVVFTVFVVVVAFTVVCVTSELIDSSKIDS